MGRDISKGDLPTLILAVIAEEPSHGYAIARSIELRSKKAFLMKEGTLYPMLRTLEQEGCVVAVWEVQPSGPARKVYRITDHGRSELAKRQTEWEEYAQSMRAILGGRSDAQTA